MKKKAAAKRVTAKAAELTASAAPATMKTLLVRILDQCSGETCSPKRSVALAASIGLGCITRASACPVAALSSR